MMITKISAYSLQMVLREVNKGISVIGLTHSYANGLFMTSRYSVRVCGIPATMIIGSGKHLHLDTHVQ